MVESIELTIIVLLLNKFHPQVSPIMLTSISETAVKFSFYYIIFIVMYIYISLLYANAFFRSNLA